MKRWSFLFLALFFSLTVKAQSYEYGKLPFADGDTLLYRDEHAFFTKKEGKLAALLYHYPLSSTVSMSPYPDRSRAQKELETGDPYYNPNLSLRYEDYRIAKK